MPHTAYQILLQHIFARSGSRYGAGPAGFKRLLKRLGNPQKDCRIIHVAGTNGKGSVCHLCAEALQAAGYKTGLFVSPHLSVPQERIRINGKMIAPSVLARISRTVLEAEEEKLNFFEIITAVAFLYFSQNKVQYAVLETGLGGRKDPTNACTPAACLITSVGLDHCALLGGTLAQIAREKAGIIKPGVPIFCPVLEREAAREIKKKSASLHAPLHIVRPGRPFALKKIDWKRGRLLLQKGPGVWPLHLPGEKQTQNACLVYRVCRFVGVKDAALKRAFARVCVPCRFEVLHSGKNTLVFDGAHNPQAVRSFTDFFARSPWGNAALVCGFMRDKDYKEMLRLFAPRFAALYVTVPPGPRAASLAQAYAALRELSQAGDIPDRGVLPAGKNGFAEDFSSSSFWPASGRGGKERALSVRAERSAQRSCGPFVLPCGTKVFFFASPARALTAACKAYKTAAVTGSFYLAGYLRARKGLTENSDCD